MCSAPASYCCLGVLYETDAREGVVAKEWDGVEAFYGGEREFPPAAGRRWA